jgi:general secretion pathway protein G
MKMMKVRAAARGFSLLELMLVLAIIGVMTAIAAYSLSGRGEAAKRKATRTTMEVVAGALDAYYLEKSSYPPTLSVLMQGNAYLDERKGAKDGWNRDLLYQAPGASGRKFDLFSSGGNAQFENGAGDDVDFWKADSDTQ